MKAHHPFTVAWVREAIESLGRGYRVPPERGLEYMASRLNGDFVFYTSKDQASANAARASEVRNALKVLACFHEDRWKELLAASHIPPDIVERETQLRDKFNAYRVEMSHWRFSRYTCLPHRLGAVVCPPKAGMASRRALRTCSRRS